MVEGYDIIGDIHGEADALERLLHKLDCELIDGCRQHGSRQVIFFELPWSAARRLRSRSWLGEYLKSI